MRETETLERRVRDSDRGLRTLLALWEPTHSGKWDNRDSWDNKTGGGGWDNRPGWDNWDKK
ncbi:multiple cyclophane-containing RiPP AmcA [Actinoalloteichus spitiensis]|uniref:multiple cyclophane-containing RiPP AmcA n=1 Tax=Actinoalloteichus spitiensis TaxID=252394 RepID=UPI000A047A4F